MKETIEAYLKKTGRKKTWLQNELKLSSLSELSYRLRHESFSPLEIEKMEQLGIKFNVK